MAALDTSFLKYLLADDGGSGSRGGTALVKLARLYQRDRWRWSAARRRDSLEEIPIKSPIFVLGLQSGGTTLISRCIRRHRDVLSISGDHRHWTGTDEVGNVRNRLAQLPRSLWGCKYRVDIAHPLYGDNHSSVFACDELLPYYRLAAGDVTDDTRSSLTRLIREHVAVYARDSDRARFLDKTHTTTVRVSFLDELLRLYEPRFILVTRDPYTTCRRAVRRKPPSYREPVSDADRLRAAAEHWHNCFRIALDDGLGMPNFTVVRFEDFLRYPEAVTRRLCAFLDLDFVPAMVPSAGDSMPFATLRSDRKWFPLYADDSIADASPEDLAIVEERCGDLAAQLGYVPVRAGGP
jgi:Sulfotransferase family